jgi:hypothetical protein
MDIMHSCDIIPFNGQEKKNKEKHKQRLVISEYLEPYFSTTSAPYLPI